LNLKERITNSDPAFLFVSKIGGGINFVNLSMAPKSPKWNDKDDGTPTGDLKGFATVVIVLAVALAILRIIRC
jgi:hypothetical protein